MTRVRGRGLALCATLALALASAGAAAASPLGTATQVTAFSPARTSSSDAGQFSTVATDPETGSGIAFYYAKPQGGAASAAYYAVRALDASGAAVGSEIPLLTGTGAKSNSNLAVAYNPVTGGWLACYPNYATGVNDTECRLLAANGTPSAPAFAVNDTTAYTQNVQVSMAWSDADARFLVGWSGTTDANDLYARFVSTAGAAVGSEFSMEPDPVSVAGSGGSQIAYASGADTYISVRRGKTSAAGEQLGPWVQLFDSSGARIGSPSRLGTATIETNNPSVSYGPETDEYLVVWSATGAAGKPVYAQRLDASTAATVGSPSSMPLPTGEDGATRYRIDVAGNPFAAEYLLTTAYKVGGVDIAYGQLVDGSAAPLTGAPEAISSGQSGVNRPSGAFDAAGCRYLNLWSGTPNGSSAYDLYSRFFGWGGSCVRTLAVERTGTGSGTVSSDPAGIICGETCFFDFTKGSEVTLTATPGPLSTFEGWSGACSGEDPCEVTLDDAASVGARFDGPPVPPPVGRPIVIQAGPAGRASLRVRVGCAGDDACRIRLTGRRRLKRKTGMPDAKVEPKRVSLGELVSQSVALGAGERRFVRLRYTPYLRRTIVRAVHRGNAAKIRVTAAQQGARKRTIVVKVRP